MTKIIRLHIYPHALDRYLIPRYESGFNYQHTISDGIQKFLLQVSHQKWETSSMQTSKNDVLWLAYAHFNNRFAKLMKF